MIRFSGLALILYRLILLLLGAGPIFCSFLLASKTISAARSPGQGQKVSYIYSRRSKAPISCKIPGNSIISSLFSSTDLRGVVVVLDGYPSNTLFQKLTGHSSHLHKELLSLPGSTQFSSYNPIALTPLSLSHIFASNNFSNQSTEICPYPFVGTPVMPNLLLANAHFIDTGSICKEQYRSGMFVLSMRFREIHNAIRKYINITYPAFRNPCGITDSKTLALLLRKMSGGLDKKVSFIHEMGHHDEVLYKEKNYKDNLLRYDFGYAKSLIKIGEYLEKTRSADYLLVLSDHGPRTGFFGPIDAKIMEIGSWQEIDTHSYFLYFIPLSGKKGLTHISRSLSTFFKSNIPERYKYDFRSQNLVKRSMVKKEPRGKPNDSGNIPKTKQTNPH